MKTPWRNMKRRCCACAARCWATPRWRRTPCRIPRGDSSEKTWLTHIAVNVCRDLQRKGWFRHEDRRVSLDTLPEPAAPCTAQQDALARAVLCLPLPCRQAVLLRYYQQMTLPEAAQAGVAVLLATPASQFLAAGVERVLTIFCHIALSELVMLSVSRARLRYAALALGLHTLLDFAVVLVNQLAGAWAAEAVLALFAVGAIALTRYLMGRFPYPKDALFSTEAVPKL